MINIKNLYWFRHDLRLTDNIALYNCSKREKSAAIYIYDFNIINDNNFSNLHSDFINDSLLYLSDVFKKHGAHLNIFYGQSIKVIKKIIDEYNVHNIYSHHEVRDLKSREINRKVKLLCSSARVEWYQYQRKCQCRKVCF